MKKNAYCASKSTWLGEHSTVQGCAKACSETEGCTYFIYGYSGYKEYCYYEHTPSALCPEQWKASDHYNFYQITRDTGNYILVVMFHTNKHIITPS